MADVPAKPVGEVQTRDSFNNFMSRVGIGPGGAGNPSQGATYGFNPITRNRTLCEWMYRGSWIVQRAVDAVAEDMIRKGVELKGLEPDDNELIDQQLALLGAWTGVEDTIRWARLFGGAIGIMLIDGQDTKEPLRVETIAKDQFRGMLVLDRWVAWPNLNDLVTDLGPDLGKPRYYDVPAGMPGVPPIKVHYSRVIRLEGHNLPYFQRTSENGWGASIIEVLYDRLVAFDSTTQGTAQLVYRAHLRTVKVQKLREIIAAGGPPMEALMAQFEMMRRFQTNEGLTLLDSNDEFESFQFSFGGLDAVLEQFGDQLCGALRIPRTRLFGESPGGLNSTGDSDMQAYDQDIASLQNSKLRRGTNILLQVAHRSVLGRPPDGTFTFVFKPLWEMTEKERGEIAAQTTTAVVQAFDAGIVDRERALSELRQSGEVTGLWTTISDEDIEDAKADPPLSEQANEEHVAGMMGPMMGGPPGFGGKPPAGGPGGDQGHGKPGEPPPSLKGGAEGPPKPGVNAPARPANVSRLPRPMKQGAA
jgi:hypothetical protein